MDFARMGAVALVFTCASCGDDMMSGTSDGVSSATHAATQGTTETGGSTGPTTGDAATGGATTSGPTSDGATTSASSSGSSGSSGSTGETGSTSEPACPQGEVICEGGVAKVCDGSGGFEQVEACADACAPGLGCVLCVPGEHRCEGALSLVCNQDGTAWQPEMLCDAVQGVSCDEALGECVGACSKASLGLSYIGCDYYPTVTQQNDYFNDAPDEVFAVAVANTSDVAVEVTITRGPDAVAQLQVPAASVTVKSLPWIAELTEGTGPSVLVAQGAYRLRADHPVTVYQYNPLEATFTNDASLLLPVNTWGERYVVASYAYWDDFDWPGFYAVVASEDQTTVTLGPSATTAPVQPGAGVGQDGAGVVTLDRGDVLQVITDSGGDATGTIVTADAPIQVISGHACTNVPSEIAACDHLEESMIPIKSLAKEYVIVPPVQVPDDAQDKAQVVRVIASEDDTQLTFEPDQGAATMLASAGDFVELETTTAAFKVSADKKILVAQYMVGQDAGYGSSDPAMLITVPPAQFRDNYLFHAATGWQANYVDIVAEDGAAVTVDGSPVTGWSTIGATGFKVAHVQLSNMGDGSHSVTADENVGVSVYGVQGFGSYWYPGGLDLNLIPE